MTWYAIDAVKPAVDRTRLLLFKPFRPGFWLKLAFIAFLMGVGGGGGGSGGGGNFGGGDNIGGGESVDYGKILEALSTAIMENLLIIVAVAAIVILIALLISYIRAVMYFIFLDSVIKSRVEILAGFRRYKGKGFRILLFEMVVDIAFISCIIIPALTYYLVFGIPSGMMLWASLAAGILALIALIMITSIVMSFTRSFVVPYMYEGRGLISGWKRLLHVLRINIGQTIVYLLVNLILALVTMILGLVIAVLVLLILAIPGIIIGIVLIVVGGLVLMSGVCSGSLLPLCVVTGIVALIVVVLTVSYLITLAMLPITVFYRFYTLIFLARMDTALKIPGIENVNGK